MSAPAEATTEAPVAPPRPPTRDLLILTVGILSASTAGPLVAATAAPALAIAFWRNALACLVLVPFVAGRCRRELAGLPGRVLGLALLGGTLLAGHFASLTPAFHDTSVASAAALVCSQAIFAALLTRILGERLPLRTWAGIGIALLGALLVTGVDFSVSGTALRGDLLALLAGLFGGGYIVTGGRVRRVLSTAAYTSICYSSCAGVLLVGCLVAGIPLGGYAGGDWARIVALTLTAQLLGHSIFNFVLRSISPTAASLATLFTVPGGAILAALLLGQVPPPAVLPALGLLLAGTGLVLSPRRAPRAAAATS